MSNELQFIQAIKDGNQELIDNLYNKVQWYWVSNFENLDVDKFANKLNWENISYDIKLNEDSLNKFGDKLKNLRS